MTLPSLPSIWKEVEMLIQLAVTPPMTMVPSMMMESRMALAFSPTNISTALPPSS